MSPASNIWYACDWIALMILQRTGAPVASTNLPRFFDANQTSQADDDMSVSGGEYVSEQRKLRHCAAAMSHGSRHKHCGGEKASKPMKRIPTFAQVIAVLRHRSQKHEN